MSINPFIETAIDHTGKHKLEFLQKVHRYKLDGEFVPGATDTKKGYPPGRALIRYWIKQGLEEFDGGFKLKAQADVGTLTHDYCHAIRTHNDQEKIKVLKQVPGHKDEEKIKRRLSDADKWCKDRESEEEVIMAEKICAMIPERVAGKFDVIVRRKDTGLLRLQDYKSAKGHFEDAFIQEGGYSKMILSWYGLKISELEVIRFNDNVDYPDSYVVEGNDVQDFEKQFMTCLDTRNFQRKWGAVFEAKYKKENPWIK
jgi:hypothetical protein